MAALIEHLARWLAGGGFVERKEEHAALGGVARWPLIGTSSGNRRISVLP